MSKVDPVEKELRNKKILDLHNEGKSISEIVDLVGMSKGGIHKVLSSFLDKADIPNKKNVVEVKVDGDEEVIASFIGLTRLNVNEYVNEKTSEVIRVAFIKSTVPGEFGKFVKLK